MSVNSDIELIKKDVGYLRQFIEEDRTKFNDHIEESKSYRSKVDEMSVSHESEKDVLKNHIVSDRWFFGILVTILIAILGKLFVQ